MQTLLKQILQELNQNRSQQYWQGFTITAFAVYDQKDVYLFNHPKCVAQRYIKIPKTNQFTACTLILFEEFPTAIVDVTIYNRFEEIYSIIIHELFHGYQYTYGEARFPDEITGLSYPIDAQNINLRIQERKVLHDTVFAQNQNDQQQFINEFIALREARMNLYPEFLAYEAAIETVEGPAHYVEYKALQDIQQPNMDLQLEFSKMLLNMEEAQLQIRKSCYSSGLFLCLLFDAFSNDWQQQFVQSNVSLFDFLKQALHTFKKVTPVLTNNQQQVNFIIQKAQAQKTQVFEEFHNKESMKLIIKGLFKLVGFDPMNITILNNQAIHHNFVKVKIDNNTCVIQGPLFTTFNKDFTHVDSIQLYLNTPPEQNDQELYIAGLGLLNCTITLINNDYYLSI